MVHPASSPLVYADPLRCKQILYNLLSNAVKFTPEGGKIEVEFSSKAQFVCVSVSDSGIGIRPEDREMIFEEFRQAAVTTKGERVWDLPLPNGSSNRMAGKYGWRAKLEKAAGSASPCPKVRLPQLPSLQGHRGTVELHSQLRAAAAPSLNHFCEGYMLNGRRHFLRLQAKFVQDQVLALAHRFSVAHIDISSHLKCAVVHELQGHLNQAILGCRKACELSGNRPVMLSLLGHALAKSGETAEAEGIIPTTPRTP